MKKVRVTKEFTFETAHALYGYDGKCRNLHGHSYHLAVTLIGTPLEDPSHPKNGMVIDFSDLKRIVKEEIVDPFDHTTVFNKNSPHKELGEELMRQGHDIILTDYHPTTEMMIIDFAQKIKNRLPDHLELCTLRLRETGTSYAEWHASDQV